MEKDIQKILQVLLSYTEPYELPADTFSSEMISRKHSGEILIQAESSLHYIHILLNGSCRIEKYGIQGNSLLERNINPLQFFGLYEAIHGLSSHTVSIRCASDCIYLKIPVGPFIACIKKDNQLAWMCLRYLSSFIHKTLSQNDNLLMNDIRQNLLLYIYRQCQEKSFPVILTVKKEELAQELNVNLRTLYRKLNLLYEEDLLTPGHRKIIVTQKQFTHITQELIQQEII